MMNKPLFFLLMLISVSVQAQDASHVFVFLNSKPDKEMISDAAAEELQTKHRASISQLVNDGKLIVAGPFNGGGGIFILNTNNSKEAQEWLQNDPAIRANRWDVEFFPISFISGGACLAKTPYEMVTYKFARLHYVNEIANYKMNTSRTDLWHNIAAQDSIIMLGRFPRSDGGIVIYRGENHTWLDGLSNELVSFSFKELWVAKGSFCEQP